MAHSQNHLFFLHFNPHDEFPMHNPGSTICDEMNGNRMTTSKTNQKLETLLSLTLQLILDPIKAQTT